MQLVHPDARYKESFIEAVKEFQGEHNVRAEHYRRFALEELEGDFDGFCERQRQRAQGRYLPPGYVPETVLWLVDAQEYIGRVSIRHLLTEDLRAIGGHIGDDIRPSMRRRGYGTTIVRLALPEARKLGITRALLTCDETNVASRKVIERNGGIFENKVPNPEGGPDKLRFWIDLSQVS